MVLTGDDERDGGREAFSTSQGELAGNKTSNSHFVVCLCLAGSGTHKKGTDTTYPKTITYYYSR